MSFLDMYRRNTARKQEEISRLAQQKANEVKKISDLNVKINRASDAANRSSSNSTLRSKLREIERYRNDSARVEKKIADLERQLATKQKQLLDEQKKVSREEDRELRKRQQAAEKQAKEYELRMKRVDSTLADHGQRHRRTQEELQRLQQLPDKITVLFLASNPLDQQHLRLDEEVRQVTEMIRKSKHRDSVSLESCWAVRPMDVLQALNEWSPAIVHFSGHGSDRDEIIFQDAAGNAKPVTKEAIVQTMMASAEGIRLVFFNTCYSRNQAEAVVAHVEAAVGMKTGIGDEAARVFAAQFYSSIGFGHSVAQAFEQARALLMMEGVGEEDTPELFTRSGVDPAGLVIVGTTDG